MLRTKIVPCRLIVALGGFIVCKAVLVTEFPLMFRIDKEYEFDICLKQETFTILTFHSE